MIPVIFLVLFSTVAGAAEEVIVEQVSSEWADGTCYVDARIHFNLHDDLLEALDHGVDLDVRITIRVKEPRKWLWDRLYSEEVIAYKLDHLLLSKVYIVTNTGKARHRQFDTLENALKYLGTLERYPLFTNADIADGTSLVGLLKTEMNVENLPPPLKPVAALLNKWQSGSAWHAWTITP